MFAVPDPVSVCASVLKLLDSLKLPSDHRLRSKVSYFVWQKMRENTTSILRDMIKCYIHSNKDENRDCYNCLTGHMIEDIYLSELSDMYSLAICTYGYIFKKEPSNVLDL